MLVDELPSVRHLRKPFPEARLVVGDARSERRLEQQVEELCARVQLGLRLGKPLFLHLAHDRLCDVRACLVREHHPYAVPLRDARHLRQDRRDVRRVLRLRHHFGRKPDGLHAFRRHAHTQFRKLLRRHPAAADRLELRALQPLGHLHALQRALRTFFRLWRRSDTGANDLAQRRHATVFRLDRLNRCAPRLGVARAGVAFLDRVDLRLSCRAVKPLL